MKVTFEQPKRAFVFTGDPKRELWKDSILERLGLIKKNWLKIPNSDPQEINACNYMFQLNGEPIEVDPESAARLAKNNHFKEVHLGAKFLETYLKIPK